MHKKGDIKLVEDSTVCVQEAWSLSTGTPLGIMKTTVLQTTAEKRGIIVLPI